MKNHTELLELATKLYNHLNAQGKLSVGAGKDSLFVYIYERGDYGIPETFEGAPVIIRNLGGLPQARPATK
jgi:hypothetical protein